MPLRGKNRTPSSITLEALTVSAAYGPFSIAASQGVDTVQTDQVFVIPQASKLLRVGATAATVSGAPCIQVVLGTGAPSVYSGQTDEYAVLGTAVFNAPITLTCNNYTGQTIAPGDWDTQYASGDVLTLRAISGEGDTCAGLRINVSLLPIDEHPTQPLFTPLQPQDL